MGSKTQIEQGNSARGKWWVLLAVGIGTFMSALDGSVVNTILPVIRDYFNSDVAAVEWTVTVYLLVISSLLLLFGRLGDLRGHKKMYITGFVIFVAASAVCGFSPTVAWLVLARAVQAVGAAMLYANSPAILTRSFPPSQRGQALGMQATMTYLGLTAGPSLGGWLAQSYGWRAVFYINVPVGLLAFALSMAFIKEEDAASLHAERFDFKGALLFSSGLVLLLLGLNEGHDWGWASPGILGCLLGAAVMLGIFLRVESRVESPMLDLSLFRIRVFSASTASAVINYICLYSVIFLMPFYLIQGRGMSPAHAGLLLTAQPVIMAIVAPISGSLSDKLGSRVLSTLGMSVMAAGVFLISRLTGISSELQVMGSLAVAGLGTGIFISPNTSALLGSAPRQRQGIASGILATARNVGMVLGVGMAGAIFTSILSSRGDGALFSAVQAGFTAAAALALLGIVFSAARGKTGK